MFWTGFVATEGHPEDLKYGVSCQAQQSVSYRAPSLPVGFLEGQLMAAMAPWRGSALRLGVCSVPGLFLVASDGLWQRTSPKSTAEKQYPPGDQVNEVRGSLNAGFQGSKEIVWIQSSGF